ncbi:MAG: hypothetical protein CMG74_13260 [Candidatus Marinimicrobia bacterium]|nr:hypothetical protein [Candidatus Neomarinimicrobiota bacterium]|tara:strand:+ start:80897 stop:82804 length:1908 start_codon:yes stop_codon:yes gene_type:complete
MNKIFRILLISLSIDIVFAQNAEELKRFMETYNKLKVDQQANDIVKQNIDADKGLSDGLPVKVLVNPSDISKYYEERMNVIQKELKTLNSLLLFTDTIPPISNFGYNYFSHRDSIQFIDNANVSADYILGYGDEVIISVWGQAEQYEKKILNRDGTIFVDNVGLLYLGGKNQDQAKSYIFNRFSKVYATLNSKPKQTFLEFSIGKIKNINVSVSGHVQFPGNYVVNPSINIPNILILAGGVNSTGSLRNIFVQRASSFVDTLDIYPLITGVGIVDHIPLYEGDIIIVPSRGQTVAVTGNVLNPAYYELKAKESISSIIKYAGFKNIDSNQKLIVARSPRPSIYLNPSDLDKSFLMDGDSLILPVPYSPIRSISISVANREFTNIPWVENLSFSKILDIISIDQNNVGSVEVIRRNMKNNKQEVVPFDKEKNEDFIFEPLDHLTIHLFELFTPTKTVVVKGNIISPGTYPLINNEESLLSIINRAGGLRTGIDIRNVLVKRDTLTFGSENGDLILTPGDTIIANPLVGTVNVEGEVHNPGNFEWTKNNTAGNYISFAGGLTTYGDKKHIVYITPYGQATRITYKSNEFVMPGSTIRVSEKPLSEQNVKPDRFSQISSIVTSLVSIAILANTTKNNQ